MPETEIKRLRELAESRECLRAAAPINISFGLVFVLPTGRRAERREKLRAREQQDGIPRSIKLAVGASAHAGANGMHASGKRRISVSERARENGKHAKIRRPNSASARKGVKGPAREPRSVPLWRSMERVAGPTILAGRIIC
jgi:hypothetical protein